MSTPTLVTGTFTHNQGCLTITGWFAVYRHLTKMHPLKKLRASELLAKLVDTIASRKNSAQGSYKNNTKSLSTSSCLH